MAIDYAVQYQKEIDKRFTEASQAAKVTNQNYKFTGGASIKVYSVSTAVVKPYDRTTGYGNPETLNATTTEYVCSQDDSFSIIVDKMDMEETGGALNPLQILEAQIVEQNGPKIDRHTYKVMAEGAGTITAATPLTKTNVYSSILAASEALDEAKVPQVGRKLVVTPKVYNVMKQSTEIILDTELSDEQRKSGIIAVVDGMEVVKVTASQMPAGVGFLAAHPIATVQAVKLAEYGQVATELFSGIRLNGRFRYDAFVLENKKMGVYAHREAAATALKA